jgi:hypothetical protein
MVPFANSELNTDYLSTEYWVLSTEYGVQSTGTEYSVRTFLASRLSSTDYGPLTTDPS